MKRLTLGLLVLAVLLSFGCAGVSPKKTPEEVLSKYKELVHQNPNDAQAHYNLGVTYANVLRQYQEAIPFFKEAIRINPDDAFAHYWLGKSYENTGRYNEAIASYRDALRINPGLKFVRDRLKLGGQVPRVKPSSPPRQRVSQPSAKQQLLSGGTGFLFSSRDYVITNYHVVKGASSIDVKFPGGEIINATVQAKDSQNDIAVLKLAQSPSTPIPDLKFGDSSKVRPGDRVFTIGYPASSILGKNQKITDGIISSVTGIGDDPTMFQITVPIQPGNSGGPLFNERGEVIGITTASLSLNAIQSLGAVPQNVNYAIKSSFVNNLLTTIPKTLLSNRGIVVVPNKPGNSLSDFFERVSNNIVLIEAK